MFAKNPSSTVCGVSSAFDARLREGAEKELFAAGPLIRALDQSLTKELAPWASEQLQKLGLDNVRGVPPGVELSPSTRGEPIGATTKGVLGALALRVLSQLPEAPNGAIALRQLEIAVAAVDAVARHRFNANAHAWDSARFRPTEILARGNQVRSAPKGTFTTRLYQRHGIFIGENGSITAMLYPLNAVAISKWLRTEFNAAENEAATLKKLRDVLSSGAHRWSPRSFKDILAGGTGSLLNKAGGDGLDYSSFCLCVDAALASEDT